MTTTTNIKQRIETLKKNVTPAELEAALKIYCRFHLKAGDLEAVPELRKYITADN